VLHPRFLQLRCKVQKLRLPFDLQYHLHPAKVHISSLGVDLACLIKEGSNPVSVPILQRYMCASPSQPDALLIVKRCTWTNLNDQKSVNAGPGLRFLEALNWAADGGACYVCACWRMALPCAYDLAAVASNTACLCLLLCSPRALLWLHGMLALQCFLVATPFPSTGQPSAQDIERGLTALYVRCLSKHDLVVERVCMPYGC